MKLHILSDLHTEFADFDPSDTDADVVVLAGVRFLGTTLWTDFRLYSEGESWFSRETARRQIDDFT